MVLCNMFILISWLVLVMANSRILRWLIWLVEMLVMVLSAKFNMVLVIFLELDLEFGCR